MSSPTSTDASSSVPPEPSTSPSQTPESTTSSAPTTNASESTTLPTTSPSTTSEGSTSSTSAQVTTSSVLSSDLSTAVPTTIIVTSNGQIATITTEQPTTLSAGSTITTTATPLPSNKNKTAIIAGSVVGGVAAIVIAVLAIFLLKRRARKQRLRKVFDGDFDPARTSMSHSTYLTGGEKLPPATLPSVGDPTVYPGDVQSHYTGTTDYTYGSSHSGGPMVHPATMYPGAMGPYTHSQTMLAPHQGGPHPTMPMPMPQATVGRPTSPPHSIGEPRISPRQSATYDDTPRP